MDDYVPLIYALLPNKEEGTCERFFRAVKGESSLWKDFFLLLRIKVRVRVSTMQELTKNECK